MFTVCPKCTLTLAVTANDLRVGQGYVRCGRCSNVFNALLKLSEAPAEGAGADLPELPQADPASTSQIHRAITAAAIDGVSGSMNTAAAASPARPAARAPSAPAPARGPVSAPAPAPGTAASAVASTSSATAPSAAASRPTPTVSTAPATAAARPVPGASTSTAPAAAAASAHAASPAAMRAATVSSAAARPVPPAPSGPSSPAASVGDPAGQRPRTAQSPSLTQALRKPAAPVPAPAAAPAAAPAPPAKEGDADALDQFELVLQTLGLDPDGDEPPLRASGLEAEPTQTVENIVLEGDEVRQSEGRVPDKPLDELDLFTRRLGTASDSTAGALSAPPTDAPATPNAERRVERQATRRARLAGRRSSDDAVSGDAALAVARAAGRDPGEAAEPVVADTVAPDFDIPALRATKPMQQRLWLAGSVALLVLLLAQFVNHWRDALAASPTWGHPVTGLYAALGVPLQPHWDLSAYEVRQQGAESADGPHAAIVVRFSLANHATRAQPVPLLRLTLLDRYGRRVAERDLTPADYWPKGRSAQSFLAADERVDTEVQVRDPSADSASFELDVCLPAGHGGLHCAGDAAAAGAAGASPP